MTQSSLEEQTEYLINYLQNKLRIMDEWSESVDLDTVIEIELPDLMVQEPPADMIMEMETVENNNRGIVHFVMSYHLWFVLLMSQLDCLMDRDTHSGEKGFYTVRSLYFDDYQNSAMKQKEDGVDNRKKYRIRSYLSGMDEKFHLEIKYRLRDKVRKEACDLTKEETGKILEGLPIEAAYSSERNVLRQFELARDSMLLQPAVIVEYDRVPYVYPEGNVRITIDRNICASPDTGRL